MAKVAVELGARSYDIVIEPALLERSAAYLSPAVAGRRVAVVSDQVVADRYLDALAPALEQVTPRWDRYLIQDGEGAKSFAGVQQLLDMMLQDGVDRHCVVLAFGGGVVGDVAGFGASLLMRGIDLIAMPTTLMSQVDSSVGGKNGINTRQGKNLVGSFLQPRIVLNDISLLASLPPGEMRAGYGEVMKCGLLRGEEVFSWLERNAEAVMNNEPDALVETVRLGCETKAQIVSEDEYDKGKRALVNLGHTFAHAFETQAGFGHVPHGAAVAVGLVAACELSERTGVCESGLADRVRRHAHLVGLPNNLNSLSQSVPWRTDIIQEHMLHDKKTVSGRINFVLLRGIGEPFVTADVPSKHVTDVLQSLGAQ